MTCTHAFPTRYYCNRVFVCVRQNSHGYVYSRRSHDHPSSLDHRSRLTLRSSPYRPFSLQQAFAVLALFFIALWAFWKFIVRRQLITTVIESQGIKLSRKEPGSGSTSAGSLRREELDPGPLNDLENQGSTHFCGDFIAVRYEESGSIRLGGHALTGFRKQREEAKSSQSSSSRRRGSGEDIEDGENMSSSPPSIDEVLQRSVRGFREPWWTTPASGKDENRQDEANTNLEAIEGCPLQPETLVGACGALCQLIASVFEVLRKWSVPLGSAVVSIGDTCGSQNWLAIGHTARTETFGGICFTIRDRLIIGWLFC